MNREDAYKLFWGNETDVLGDSVLEERAYKECVDRIYDDISDDLDELRELREMEEWMEKNSNTSLFHWYNRRDDD